MDRRSRMLSAPSAAIGSQRSMRRVLGIRSLQLSNCTAHFVYVVDAATFGLYRCCFCDLRVRDVDRLVLREVAHGIDTAR